MSTMLRSAALTLLSKTLLTFLYKYLSDVDVEGVEMPSYFGASSDGQASGWGVRLSKVRLREGAELMILPGTKKKSTRKSKEKNDENNNAAYSNDVVQEEKAKVENGGDNTADDDNNLPRKQRNLQENGSVDLEKKRLETAKQSTQSSIKTSSTHSVDLEELAGNHDDDSMVSLHDAGSTRPETPVQETSISFLSCFAQTHPNASKTPRVEKQREQETDVSSATPSHEDREDEAHRLLTKGGKRESPRMNGHGAMNGHAFDSEISKHSLPEAVRMGIDDQLPEEASSVIDEGESDLEQEDDDSDLHCSPMALRIGEGGYIGILDVRLVGRELHVLVEDAFLALEAVRIEKEPAASKGDASSDNAATDTQSGDSNAKKPAVTPVPPIDIHDLKTTGERVLAKNPIARIFSSLPHLFLRDIVVRLIVRNEAEATEADDEFSDDKEPVADVIVDVGIGLLSVTEGEDFLSPFNTEETATHDGDSREAVMKTQTSQSGSSPDNEYLERRIRTGKGSDGGIWLNVETPKLDKKQWQRYSSSNRRWARQDWFESTHHRVLQCSGLDIQARIFLGTSKELALVNSTYSWYSTDPDTYEGIDHTLYGFDHVAPGPTPNILPPLPTAPPCTTSRSQEEGDDNGMLRSQVYKLDRNGIQSSHLESCFYRVARGMTPQRCKLEHLPCENCAKCWQLTEKTTEGSSVSEFQYLDSYTPMPGLALSVSLREPFEMNVDRLSLDAMGLVINLFKKAPEKAATTIGEDDADAADAVPNVTPLAAQVDANTKPSRGYFSSFFFGGSTSEEEASRRESVFFSPRRRKSVALPPAFPAYMTPENIQILGVFIAAIRLRVHVMREDDGREQNMGLSFCYWAINGEGLTLDQQTLTTEEKKFQDVRLDIAMLDINEIKGIQKKALLSVGIQYPTANNDLGSSFASLTAPNSRGQRPPWPTTACALLDVPGTLESMVYECRERHGIQFRLLEVSSDHALTGKSRTRTLINCQVGAMEVDLPWPVEPVITGIKTEALKSLGFVNYLQPPAKPAPVADNKKDTATQYRLQLGGGRIRLGSMVDMRLPLTRLAGDLCPESGFSMETLLERVELSHGTSCTKFIPTACSIHGVSLRRFPSLPDNVRLRILLFVEDLEPLEKALGVKKQSNSFLRCHAVNKGLGKLATKRGKKKSHGPSPNKVRNRRQDLMNKLLTLDDDALENLWASHVRKEKKKKGAPGSATKKTTN